MDIQQAMYPNATLLVQAILFLLFTAIIRSILVKPYSQIMEERERLIQKNTEESLKLREEAGKYLSQAHDILEKGRRESHQMLDQARREAERLRIEILAKVEQETQEEIAKAVEEIRKSLEEEKRKLDERVKDVAELITSKVLEEAA